MDSQFQDSQLQNIVKELIKLTMLLRKNVAEWLGCKKEGQEWEILFFIIFTVVHTIKTVGGASTIALSDRYFQELEGLFKRGAEKRGIKTDKFMQSLKKEMSKRLNEYEFSKKDGNIEDLFIKSIKNASGGFLAKRWVITTPPKIIIDNIERTIQETIRETLQLLNNN